MSEFGELVNLTDTLVAGVPYAEMCVAAGEPVVLPARATEWKPASASCITAPAVPETALAELSAPVGVGRWARLLNLAAELLSSL